MEKKANNKKKKLLTVVLVFTVVLAVTATTWCIQSYESPRCVSLPAPPKPPDPPKPITCSEKTTHFDSGCELLLRYDTDNDGIISSIELAMASDDRDNDVITEREWKFVMRAYVAHSINKLCPGCYSP